MKLEEFKVGQVYHFNWGIFKEGTEVSVISCRKFPRYGIEDEKGKLCKSLGRQDDGSIKFIYPEEEGRTPDYTQLEVELYGKDLGLSIHLTEDNLDEISENLTLLEKKDRTAVLFDRVTRLLFSEKKV